MLVINAPMIVPVTGRNSSSPRLVPTEMILIRPIEVVLPTELEKTDELYGLIFPVLKTYFDESQVFKFEARGLHVGSPLPQWFPDLVPDFLTNIFQALQRRCLRARHRLVPIKVEGKPLVEGSGWNLDETLRLVRIALDRKVGFELLAPDGSYVSFGWDGDVYLGSHYDLGGTTEVARVEGLVVIPDEPYPLHMDL